MISKHIQLFIQSFYFYIKKSYCSEFDGKKVVGKPVSFLPESPKMRLFVKDWVAQWDPLYNAWFYYHPGTGWVTKNKPGGKCFKTNILFRLQHLGQAGGAGPHDSGQPGGGDKEPGVSS